MKIRRIIALVFFLLCSLNCRDAGVDIPNVLIAETQKSSYTLGEQILFRIESKSNTPAYFWHCNNQIGCAIEKKQPDQSWPATGSIGLVCLAIYVSGIKELAQGDTISQIISWNQAGVYRLRFVFGWNKNNPSSESLVSNEFTIQ